MAEQLDGMKVAIVAADMFEEAELVEPRQALEDVGAEITILAPHDGEIQGAQHDEKTIKVPVDEVLSQADSADYDALLLPGGAMNADLLRADEDAQRFVSEFDEAGKPMAVICHAPWLLVSAELVEGRRLTSYHAIADDIRNAGGDWVDEEVVVDDNWVSSRQPDDIPAFNREMLKLFKASQD